MKSFLITAGAVIVGLIAYDKFLKGMLNKGA